MRPVLTLSHIIMESFVHQWDNAFAHNLCSHIYFITL